MNNLFNYTNIALKTYLVIAKLYQCYSDKTVKISYLSLGVISISKI